MMEASMESPMEKYSNLIEESFEPTLSTYANTPIKRQKSITVEMVDTETDNASTASGSFLPEIALISV